MLHARRRRCCSSTPTAICCRSWGGPGAGYDWPKSEHGIYVDADGNVWLAGNGNDDHQILKFTPDGKFLQQIGKAGSTGGSNSTTQLGRPAHMVIDEAAGELYVADGYGNRRIVVFDVEDRRLQAALGRLRQKAPSDDKLPAYEPVAQPLSQQFANPVHCVRLSSDGLVYVCDRANDRIQVFQKDGTFVKEFRVEPQTLQNGSVWDLVLSEDARAALHLRRRRRQQARSSRSTARPARRWRASAGRAAWPANSSGCTTWRSTRRATSTPPRSAPAGARRSSSAWSSPRRRRDSPRYASAFVTTSATSFDRPVVRADAFQRRAGVRLPAGVELPPAVERRAMRAATCGLRASSASARSATKA